VAGPGVILVDAKEMDTDPAAIFGVSWICVAEVVQGNSIEGRTPMTALGCLQRILSLSIAPYMCMCVNGKQIGKICCGRLSAPSGVII
jgi:hypothetical protein